MGERKGGRVDGWTGGRTDRRNPAVSLPRHGRWNSQCRLLPARGSTPSGDCHSAALRVASQDRFARYSPTSPIAPARPWAAPAWRAQVGPPAQARRALHAALSTCGRTTTSSSPGRRRTRVCVSSSAATRSSRTSRPTKRYSSPRSRTTAWSAMGRTASESPWSRRTTASCARRTS